MVIAGGGPAGLTLSILCADAGYQVLLIEKEQYPFHKVCGEYVSMESYDFIRRLGLPLHEMNLPVINTLQLSDAKGRLYAFDLSLGGFGISRFTLDNALYQIAKSKQVELVAQTKVLDMIFEKDKFIIHTTKENYQASVAAAAYGKRSNIDVKWQREFILTKPAKLNNYIGVKYHIRYAHPENLIALHNFKNGYCGISKIEDEKCCLCYLTTAENLQSNENSIQQMEQQMLWKNPRLKEIFSNAEFLYKDPLVISQISFSQKSQSENHILMIGDAAGMIAPLCGNGMSMAMYAAKIAFENIHLFLQKKISATQMETKYKNEWRQLFQRRLFIGRSVQRFFGNNISTSLFLKLMKSNKWLAEKIIRSTHGTAF